ncbi:unnamed protein product [Mucor fragilis]
MYQQIYENYGQHHPQQQHPQQQQQQPSSQSHPQQQQDDSHADHHSKSIFFHDNSNSNQTHYASSLNGSFNLRYPSFDASSFDPHTTSSSSSASPRYDPSQASTSASTQADDPSAIHAFSHFHAMSSPQDLVASLTNTPVFSHVEIGSTTAATTTTSTSSPTTTITATTTMLPPLNTTPIIMAPLQHHQTTSHQTYLLAQKKPLKGSPRPSRERAPWTPEEDNLLKLAVQLYGDKTEKWAKIAACVPGRTNKNCRKRWFHSLDPSLRKGAWTEEEDQLLREGVSKYPNQWSKIADMLPGRTDDQCAKRWRESLDPSIDRSEWTLAEDTLLMDKYEEYGSQWQKIAFFFDGRPGLHCRNRWRKLQRMVQVKKDKEGNANASFFNTMAGEQPLRFQHTNPTLLASSTSTSKTIPAMHHNNTTALPHADISSSNTTTTTTTPSSCTQPHATHTMPHHIHSTDASQSFQHLTTLLQQQQQQQQQQHMQQHQTQQHQQTGQDPSVLVQYNHSNANHSTTPTQEDYEDYGNGLKPYGCDIPGCYAVFADSSGLFYHMKNTHPNLNGIGKPFRCAMVGCTKKYKNINGLQYHIKDAKGTTGHGGGMLADDDRPYRCMIGTCKKAYRTASGFRYHQQNGHQVQQQPAVSMSPTATAVLPQQQQQQQHQQQFRMKQAKWVMEGV